MVLCQAWPRAAHAQLALDPVGAVGGLGAYGAPWRFGASLGATETWSDNINLQSGGNRRSDFVTEIDPSFSIFRTSRRLQLNLSYTPQYIYYANKTNGTQLRNGLSSSLNASLIENLLFFDGSANISQQNISPFGTQAANSVNGSNNRAEARTITFGPTLRSRLDQDLTYAFGYHYTLSSTDSAAVATSRTSNLYGNAQTSTSFRDIGLGVNFSRSEQQFGALNDVIVEQIGTTLTYVLQPTIHLSASIGYDHDRYPTTGQPDLKGLSYSAGFDWEPSRHTSLNAQFGHRYFGPTANVRLTESTAHVSISGIYSQDQSTQSGGGFSTSVNPNYQLLDQFLLPTISDPAQRALAVTQALQQAGLSTSRTDTSTFLTNQIYVQKLAQLNVALLGRLNTVTFSASRTESRGLSNLTVGFDIFDQTSRFRSDAYSLNWSYRLGPRVSLNAGVQKTISRALEGSGSTNARTVQVSLSGQVARTVSGSVQIRNQKQNGTGDTGGFYSGNFHENAVIGSLRTNF